MAVVPRNLAFMAVTDKRAASYIREGLQARGVSEVKLIDGGPSSADELAAKPDVLLVLEWRGVDTLRLIKLSKKEQYYDKRPIYLIVSPGRPKDNLLNIIAEYRILSVDDLTASPARFSESLRIILDEKSPLNIASNAIYSLGKAIDEKLYAGAEQLARGMLRHHPFNLRTKVDLAHILIKREMWSDAEKVLDEVLAVDRNLARAHYLKYCCEAHKKEAGNKIWVFLRRAVEANPFDTDLMTEFGQVMMGYQFTVEAKKAFYQAYKIERTNKKAISGFVASSLLTRDMKNAMQALGHLGDDEEKAVAFNQAGIIAVQNKKFDLADDLYAKAEEVIKDPLVLAKVVFNRALAAFKGGNKRSGIEFLQKSLKHDPTFVKAKELAKRINLGSR